MKITASVPPIRSNFPGREPGDSPAEWMSGWNVRGRRMRGDPGPVIRTPENRCSPTWCQQVEPEAVRGPPARARGDRRNLRRPEANNTRQSSVPGNHAVTSTGMPPRSDVEAEEEAAAPPEAARLRAPGAASPAAQPAE